jgi:hypothetical protein
MRATQVLPTFFLIGIVFAPIGGVLLWGSNQVSEFTINYTQCEFSAPNDSFADMPSSQYSYHMSGDNTTPLNPPQWQFQRNEAETDVARQNRCTVQFTVPRTMDHSVFMYYKLTNYYQNHRRYVQSYDSDQFKGQAVSANTLDGGECDPLSSRGGLPIYPCGLIANSVFNGERGIFSAV